MSRPRIVFTGIGLAALLILKVAVEPVAAQAPAAPGIERWDVPARGVGVEGSSVFGFLTYLIDVNERVTLQAIGWPLGNPMVGGGLRYYWDRKEKWALFGIGLAGIVTAPGVDDETFEETTDVGMGAVAGAGIEINWPAIIGDDYPLLSSLHVGLGYQNAGLVSLLTANLGAGIHWRF